MNRLSRRRFLAGAGFAAPFLAVRPSLALDDDARASIAFPQSVASGDPSETGVVLWTRIAPGIWRAGEPVRYEVAEDAAFTRRVTAGELSAADAPERDFTFKANVDGVLKAGHTYFYRFRYRDIYSRTGRCRTLPTAGAPLSRLKLGVVTCQRLHPRLLWCVRVSGRGPGP